MICEAEGMRPSTMKTMHDFPKYIIIRKIDEWENYTNRNIKF